MSSPECGAKHHLELHHPSPVGPVQTFSQSIVHRAGFTWTVGNRRAHVHEAQSAAGEGLPAAGAAGDF